MWAGVTVAGAGVGGGWEWEWGTGRKTVDHVTSHVMALLLNVDTDIPEELFQKPNVCVSPPPKKSLVA